jgi:2,6-dihydroxypseudooxynicotine hydrolase
MQPVGVDPRVLGQFSLRHRFRASGIPDSDLDELERSVRLWDDWAQAWRGVADRCRNVAERAARQGGLDEAASSWLRAAALYHFGSYLVAPGEARRSMRDASAAAYRQRLGVTRPAGFSLSVPFGGAALPFWYRLPEGVESPPIVLLVPGLDASKEELHGLGEALVAAGVGAIGIDGPGQGELEHLPFVVEYERVVAAVLSALPFRHGRVGILGVSLGGFWAARAAAFEPRIAACASVCGPFDWSRSVPGLVPLQRALLDWKAGISAEDVLEDSHRYELASIADRLTCPVLVVHAGKDTVIAPSEGVELAAAIRESELVIYPDSVHVCHDIAPEMRSMVAEWLATKLR